MKRLFFALAAVALLSAATGCNRQYVNQGGACGMGDVPCGMAANGDGSGGMYVTGAEGAGGDCMNGGGACDDSNGMGCCKRCGGRLIGKLCHRCHGHRGMVPGPPSAQVAYPYYTVRGPRDFLCSNPPSIGP